MKYMFRIPAATSEHEYEDDICYLSDDDAALDKARILSASHKRSVQVFCCYRITSSDIDS
jgi:hypothetical protein